MKQLDIDLGPNYRDYNIIGHSERISEVIAVVKTVAPTSLSVLISGESGTGKEVIAELIHRLSERKNEKFIPINCGAIPEGLIENELFGHEKGSYTSATERSKGYFEAADRGTVFLDEIGELPLSSQVKLLRVLENGSFMRVGGSKNIRVDVRIIAATNKDLSKMVDKGTFREDLYYRLKAVTLSLPSLKERLNDIPLFVYKFASDSALKYGRPVLHFAKDAVSELTNHRWKGNIRELKNFIDMLTVMETGREIDGNVIRKYQKKDSGSANLPVLLEQKNADYDNELIFRTLLEIKNDLNMLKRVMVDYYSGERMRREASESEFLDPSKEVYRKSDEYMSEKDEILAVLKKNRGNRRKAAEELDISERTLYRKIEKYGIEI